MSIKRRNVNQLPNILPSVNVSNNTYLRQSKSHNPQFSNKGTKMHTAHYIHVKYQEYKNTVRTTQM